MHNKETFSSYAHIREQARLSIKKHAAKERASRSRKEYIATFSKKQLQKLISELSDTKPCDLDSQFEEMEKMLSQCADKVSLSEEELCLIAHTLEVHNQSWRFLELMCEKLEGGCFESMVGFGVVDVMTREFFEDKPNISDASSIIVILGHFSNFMSFGVLKYLCNRMAEVAFMHPRYLLKPLSFMVRQVFQSANIQDAEVKSFVLHFLKTFVSILNHPDADYVNIGQGLAIVLKLYDPDVLQTFVDSHFLEEFLKMFEHIRNIQASKEIQKMNYAVICFYNVALELEHKTSLQYFNKHAEDVCRILLASLAENVQVMDFRMEHYYFFSQLSCDSGMVGLLAGLDVLRLAGECCGIEVSLGSEDSLFELLYLIQTYVNNTPFGQLTYQIQDTGLLSNLESLVDKYESWSKFIVVRIVAILERIASQDRNYVGRVREVLRRLKLTDTNDRQLSARVNSILEIS